MGSYKRLYKYLSGSNDKKKKVSWVTPIFVQHSNEGPTTKALALPKKMNEEDVPLPEDPEVKVRGQNGGRFAVLRYSGKPNDTLDFEMLKALHIYLDGVEEFNKEQPQMYAYYDCNWTPGFLRR